MKKSLIFIALFVVLLSSAALADCCKKVEGSNEFCVSDISEASCEPGYFVQGVECDVVPECTTQGCCEFGDECSKGYVQAACEYQSGFFDESSPACELSQCMEKCCQVWDTYFMATASDCVDISNGQGVVLESVFDSDECASLNTQADSVCCKSENSCNDMDRDTCLFEGGEAFDEYCANVEGCACEPKFSTNYGLGEGEQDKVYWFDSCGNQESLVSKFDNALAFTRLDLDPFNGDCASQGLYAVGEDNIYCDDLNCEDLWDNDYTDENFDGNLENDFLIRKHGESWCEYQQAQIGFGRDLPGTRHSRHACVAGREVVEPLESDRSEICLESRKDSFSKAKVFNMPSAGECSSASGGGDDEQRHASCESIDGCEWIPVTGIGGWAVPIVVSRKGKCTNYLVATDCNVITEGRFISQDNYRNAEFEFTDLESNTLEKTYLSGNDFLAMECKKLKVGMSTALGYASSINGKFCTGVFDKSALKVNTVYQVNMTLREGGDLDFRLFEYSTYPPEALHGACVPIISPDDSRDCSTFNFHYPDARDWNGYMLAAPMDIEKYFEEFITVGYTEEDEATTMLSVSEELKIKFFVEMINRMATMHGRCGGDFNYAGKFTSSLSWDLPIKGGGSTKNPEKIFEAYIDNPFNNYFEEVFKGEPSRIAWEDFVHAA
jgi:hypothetical protein